MHRLASLLSVSLVVAACGGGGGGEPSVETLCSSDGLYPRYIQKLFDCQPVFEIFLGRELTSAELATACEGALVPYVDDGTTTLGTQAAFDACADWIDSSTCDELLARDADDPCDDVLVGTVAVGGLCDGNEQCEGESYCDKPDPDMCGSCVALKANGAACVASEECASQRCDGMAGTCADFVASGGACDFDGDCAGVLVCNSSMQCATEPTWAVGSPCDDFGSDCGIVETDLYCNPGTMQCAEWAALGDPCGPSGMNAVCRLIEYESCQEVPAGSGTYECVAPTMVNQGDECAPQDGTKCASGLQCGDHDGDGMTPDQCYTPLGEGDACDETNSLCDLFLECISGACQYGEYTGMCPAPEMP